MDQNLCSLSKSFIQIFVLQQDIITRIFNILNKKRRVSLPNTLSNLLSNSALKFYYLFLYFVSKLLEDFPFIYNLFSELKINLKILRQQVMENLKRNGRLTDLGVGEAFFCTVDHDCLLWNTYYKAYKCFYYISKDARMSQLPFT